MREINKAKKVYFDKSENMVRKVSPYDKENYIEKDAETFSSELRLVNVRWQNSGSYFEFRDCNGHEFYMSMGEFQSYIETHEIIIEDYFEFYKQGTIQSIGIVR